jgi:PhnB protein
MSLIPNYVPSGYKTLNVYLQVADAHKALAFYNGAFGAEILQELKDAHGVIMHAEFKIADTIVLLTETKTPSSTMLQLYTEDAAELINTLVRSGAEIIRPLEEQFYGAKSGTVRDPFGNTWVISTMMENLTQDQIRERFTNTSPQ